jgi:hypothetical protein
LEEDELWYCRVSKIITSDFNSSFSRSNCSYDSLDKEHEPRSRILTVVVFVLNGGDEDERLKRADSLSFNTSSGVRHEDNFKFSFRLIPTNNTHSNSGMHRFYIWN